MFSHLVFLLILSLVSLAQAQEVPIEVDLVPPPSSYQGVTFTIESVPPRPPEPTWTAPPITCRVCLELKVDGVCPCLEPLTQALAQKLLAQVRTAVGTATSGRVVLRQPISIRAVSSSRLRQMEGEHLLGLYQDGVIWVSDELNRRQAFGVIAHEVGHAWFFENRVDVDTPDELLFEGFPEWISYLALLEIGDRDGAARIEHADQSVYGRGARKLIARHRREGLQSVLQLVLTGRSL